MFPAFLVYQVQYFLHRALTSDVDPDPDSESGSESSESGSRGMKSLIKLGEKQSLTNKKLFFFAGNYIFQV